MSVFEEVRSVVVEIVGLDPEMIKTEANLVKDLQANSLDVVEIVTLLEEKYNITIVDDEMVDFATVGAIVEYIEARVAAN